MIKVSVPIDFEIVDLRSESEKHFRKIDGTYEVVLYSNPVHFEENGEWKDIDNSFVILKRKIANSFLFAILQDLFKL
ncbi:MAG: hypothetical protein PHX62_01620 [Bacilli bacterium]|nr:hypothetical protein [Bacilli bacterium]